MVPKSCLDCGVLIHTGNRCFICNRKKERNRSPNRLSYRDPFYMAFIKSNVCRFCGSTEDLTKDHIIPLNKGGTNDPGNIQTLCRACNSAKKDRLMQ